MVWGVLFEEALEGHGAILRAFLGLYGVAHTYLHYRRAAQPKGGRLPKKGAHSSNRKELVVLT